MRTSTSEKEIVFLSTIDEERFGIRTARAPLVTSDTLTEIINFCKVNEVRFLIARCLSSDIHTAQEMEQHGFLLMDTLLYYKRNLLKPTIPKDVGDIFIRPFQASDQNAIKTVAIESFRGYLGHYHADKRLDKAKCDEVYISWAVNSCLYQEMADEILVAEDNGQIVGFATLRCNNKEEGEGVLYGVLPIAQKKGIFRSLAIYSMNCFLFNEKIYMLYSTQITNIAVQKVWVRLGAELSHAYYTFHRWFDEVE